MSNAGQVPMVDFCGTISLQNSLFSTNETGNFFATIHSNTWAVIFFVLDSLHGHWANSEWQQRWLFGLVICYSSKIDGCIDPTANGTSS